MTASLKDTMLIKYTDRFSILWHAYRYLLSLHVLYIPCKKTAPSAMIHPGKLIIFEGVEINIYLALSFHVFMTKCYCTLKNKTLYDLFKKYNTA